MYYFILGRETVVTKMRSWLTSTKQGLWKFRQRPRPRKVLVSKKESNQCDLLDEYLFSIAVIIDPINDYNFKLVCSLKLKFICVQSIDFQQFKSPFCSPLEKVAPAFRIVLVSFTSRAAIKLPIQIRPSFSDCSDSTRLVMSITGGHWFGSS